MRTLINIGALLTVTLPIIAVLAVAIFGKFLGCWAGARLSGAKEEATMVGLSMLPRGEFSFIVAQEGTGLGVAAQILYPVAGLATLIRDRKSTRLNSSHLGISYAVFCLK